MDEVLGGRYSASSQERKKGKKQRGRAEFPTLE